jgi:hypothetical protein
VSSSSGIAADVDISAAAPLEAPGAIQARAKGEMQPRGMLICGIWAPPVRCVRRSLQLPRCRSASSGLNRSLRLGGMAVHVLQAPEFYAAMGRHMARIDASLGYEEPSRRWGSSRPIHTVPRMPTPAKRGWRSASHREPTAVSPTPAAVSPNRPPRTARRLSVWVFMYAPACAAYHSRRIFICTGNGGTGWLRIGSAWRE